LTDEGYMFPRHRHHGGHTRVGELRAGTDDDKVRHTDSILRFEPAVVSLVDQPDCARFENSSWL
jgi:hypothetical protein